MKKLILVLFLLPVQANAQLFYNFEQSGSEHWIQYPLSHWSADGISPLSGTKSLHHVFDSSEEGTSIAFFPLSGLTPEAETTRWKFKLRHGADPSSSNNWCFFLMSDCSAAEISGGAPLNGYAVGVNMTGYDDTLRLWRVEAGKYITIAGSKINWQNDPGNGGWAAVEVERSVSGNWKLSATSSVTGRTEHSYGFSSVLWDVQWSGIRYKYTSSRDMLLWIDDVEVTGTFLNDTIAPQVISASVSGRNSADILFSEAIDQANFNTDLVKLNGVPSTGELRFISKNTIRIWFANPIQNKKENTVSGITVCDLSGNCSGNLTVKFFGSIPETGDIIISEIMADPVPPVSLPQAEYLELFNRSISDFSVEGLKLGAGSQYYPLPPITLLKGQYLILCRESDTSLFRQYGKVAGMKSFPSLYDAGRLVVLSDSNGMLIHGADYDESWYNNSIKSGGGWALEMIDTRYPFSGSDNWKASAALQGGTPGIINSVTSEKSDTYFGGIRKLLPEDSLSVIIHFTEPVMNFEGHIERMNQGELVVTETELTDPLRRTFRLRLAEPLQSNRIYVFSLPDSVSDYAGNKPVQVSMKTGLPCLPEKGNIMFNELLFDPFPGGYDFIEFYSLASCPVDISRLYIYSVSEGDTSSLLPVSYEQILIMPGEYFVITGSAGDVVTRYPVCDPTRIFIAGDMPSMPDDAGNLVLTNPDLGIIDRVSYNSSFHFPVLYSTEGVSLEKVKPDLSSENTTAWHSASGLAGWATPGRPNSMIVTGQKPFDPFKFSSFRISPDGDGLEDLITIGINTGEEATIISVSLFNEDGAFIGNLIIPTLASGGDEIIWDGRDESGNVVPRGIYVVLLTAFDRKGNVFKAKRAVTVIR